MRLEPVMMPMLMISSWVISLLVIGGVMGWILAIIWLGVK